MLNKGAIKQVLGELPFTAEVYWRLVQQGKPLSKSFTLGHVERWLPEWRAQAEAARAARTASSNAGCRILIFTTLRYWIEHATLMGLALGGLGHTVTLSYLPYANWRKTLNRFDLRQQNLYARKTLQGAGPLLPAISLLDVPVLQETQLPPKLVQALQEVSLRDTQYTLQLEKVDLDGGQSERARLYQLRLKRNIQAATAALTWIESREPNERPEVILTPNGSILEMGAIYQVGRWLDIPVVTYEFGEQYGRIWLAQNAEVMRQETDALWAAYRDHSLDENQWEQMQALYASRQEARLWENFTRLWQDLPSQGGSQVRESLGLDSRPVVLLAANVIGDSLTLGRQVFSQNMTDWLERTVQFFAGRSDVQVVVRIHPGERWITGPSVAQVVREALSEVPSHIHIVEAADPINTYDLVDIADIGLVYTTTVGMEMAMSAVPVIVAGLTHYRDKGFTLDPNSWETFYKLLKDVLASSQSYRLSREQVEHAWHYAYRFFFNYPCRFPWHLLNFWNEMETWPMERVLSAEGQTEFGDVFRYLTGEPRHWSTEASLTEPHLQANGVGEAMKTL